MSDPLDGIRRALAEGRNDDALRAAERLAKRQPGDVRVARLHAMACAQSGHPGTVDAWKRVLRLQPDDPEAHYALGHEMAERADFAGAADHFSRALKRAPAHPQLLVALGLTLDELHRSEEAERHFRRAVAIDHAMGSHLVRNLMRQRKYGDALMLLDEWHRQSRLDDASLAVAYAVCLSHAGRVEDADAAFRHAIARDENNATLRRDFAAFLMRNQRYADAAAALDASPPHLRDDALSLSMLVTCRMQLADWRDVPALRTRLIERVRHGLTSSDIVPAYDFVTICDDPALQRAAAESWARSEVRDVIALPPTVNERQSPRRIGFVSSDYGNHPVGRLIIGLLERLDRQRFEVIAYATAQGADHPLTSRIAATVDRFVHIDRNDADRSARRVRADDIDVLVDLNGYSGDEAVRVFARRPAAVQIGFLGYTGTLGSPVYDFIVADRYCIAREQMAFYSEQVLHIDPCYLPSDPARSASASELRRSDYRLPDDAVVYCAFGALYKIGPELFEAWMRVLRDVPNSVLWMRHAADDRMARLRSVAAHHGVDGARIRFAPGEGVERYLARFELADVMLDTSPFGSHTTVNDALFCGIPVVTIAGMSFAGRASASQLAAIDLPDGITDDFEQYTRRAIELGLDKPRREALRSRLRAHRAVSPLFDMDAYARAFESAIDAAWAARRRG